MSKAAALPPRPAPQAGTETVGCIGTTAGRIGRATGYAGGAAEFGRRAKFDRLDGFNPQATLTVKHGVHDHGGIARGFDAAIVIRDIARAEFQMAADAADIAFDRDTARAEEI